MVLERTQSEDRGLKRSSLHSKNKIFLRKKKRCPSETP